MSKKSIISEREQLNKKNIRLSEILKRNGIKNLKLTSLGNSIASGYSAYRDLKPLLYRNESLKETMRVHDVDVDVYHFARAQNNSDDKIFNWVNSNITLSEIYEMNKVDYSNNGNSSMVTTGFLEDYIEKYYSKDADVNIQDVIFESSKREANIVIYNGLTGSFLDNVTRNGKHKLTYGIKKDQMGLEATLKFIQERNRKMNTNTQVYLCGAPNFLGTHISEFMNIPLRKIAKKYSNTVFVEPVKSKFIYDSLDNSGKKVDIHYDEVEYLELLNHIFEQINANYEFIKAKIDLDRALCKASSLIELEHPSYRKNNEAIKQAINKIMETCCGDILKSANKKEYLKNIKHYLLEVFPYDYYFLGKENIVNEINYQKRK